MDLTLPSTSLASTILDSCGISMYPMIISLGLGSPPMMPGQQCDEADQLGKSDSLLAAIAARVDAARQGMCQLPAIPTPDLPRTRRVVLITQTNAYQWIDTKRNNSRTQQDYYKKLTAASWSCSLPSQYGRHEQFRVCGSGLQIFVYRCLWFLDVSGAMGVVNLKKLAFLKLPHLKTMIHPSGRQHPALLWLNCRLWEAHTGHLPPMTMGAHNDHKLHPVFGVYHIRGGHFRFVSFEHSSCGSNKK